MATFVFETMTQAEASGFLNGDTLRFSGASVTALNLGVSAIRADSVNPDRIVLTAAGKSLIFPANQLSPASQNGTILFVGKSSLLLGTSSADSLFSTTANTDSTTADDVLYGFAGNDRVGGSTGNDYIYGGGGADTLDGGEGNDHLYGNALTSVQGDEDGNDSIIGGEGSDYLQGNAGDDILIGGSGGDRIFGGSGNDTINGGAESDSINGNVGNDSILGGDGNDIVRGGQGNDFVSGGADNDNIYGDLGDDTLAAGSGYDVLFGGAGLDIFRFELGEASNANVGASGPLANVVSIIADFVDGSDLIDLGIDVAAVVKDTQGTVFQTVSAAQTYAQSLLNQNATVSSREVAAIAIGNDTYLFWHGIAGEGAITSALKLVNVTPAMLSNADFMN